MTTGMNLVRKYQAQVKINESAQPRKIAAKLASPPMTISATPDRLQIAQPGQVGGCQHCSESTDKDHGGPVLSLSRLSEQHGDQRRQQSYGAQDMSAE